MELEAVLNWKHNLGFGSSAICVVDRFSGQWRAKVLQKLFEERVDESISTKTLWS